MKRTDFERHLLEVGCEILREGARHAIWVNGHATCAHPSHVIGRFPLGTVRAICRQLGVAAPTGR